MESLKVGHCFSGFFKNILFKFDGNDSLIGRVGFLTSGNSTLQFRSIGNGESVDTFRSAVVEWGSSRSFDIDSLEHRVLQMLNRCNVEYSSRDIVPDTDIAQESLYQAKVSSIPGLVFGATGTIHRVITKLPASSYIRNSTISMVIDFNLKFAGDFEHANHIFAEADLMYILYGYYSDQIRLYEYTNTFHVDAHAGNLLYNLDSNSSLYLIWADFGRTSTTSNPISQFRNSLMSIHNVIYKRAAASNYQRVLLLLENLNIESHGYKMDIISVPRNIVILKDMVAEFITKNFNKVEANSLLQRISPSTAFGIASLYDRIAAVEVEIEHLKLVIVKRDAEIVEIRADLKKRDAEIVEIRADMKKRDADIAKRDATISKLLLRLGIVDDDDDGATKNIGGNLVSNGDSIFEESIGNCSDSNTGSDSCHINRNDNGGGNGSGSDNK